MRLKVWRHRDLCARLPVDAHGSKPQGPGWWDIWVEYVTDECVGVREGIRRR